ncbi:MAG: 4-(cytidine 5'-diphospho)-2-C-methyl-D-erythritol kinase [Pelagibacteraceae bacterium]
MIKSYGKINLSLRVLKKMKNGFHDIQSNNVLINIYDDIFITKRKNNRDLIVFKGNHKKFISKLQNSVIKTMKILRIKKIIDKNIFYKIIINKKIPVFGGLGGGTSNSAFIVKYFQTKKISNSVIKNFEKEVGTDFRLFFYKQSFQKKLGIIDEYEKKYKLHIIIIYPNFKCSTKNIYSKVKSYSHVSKIDFSRRRNLIKYIELLKKEKNDLQKIVVSKFNKIKKIIDFISAQKGCSFSRITGSGSVCFGIFKSESSAKMGLKIIKKKFPNYWCAYTYTI